MARRTLNSELKRGSRKLQNKIVKAVSANTPRGKLLAEVKREQQRAGRKLSTARRNGVDTRSLDGRLPANVLAGMSARQLRAHVDRMKSFNSQRGWVAGVNGAPINRTAYESLKRLERRFNKVSKDYQAAVGNIEIPELGRTVSSVINDREEKSDRTAGGERATFEARNRPASGINGQSSILDLIEDMRQKLSPNYLSNRMSDLRRNIQKMLETTNDTLSQQRLQELTDHQLNVLVDYNPEFMRAVGQRYEYVKAMNAQEQEDPENHLEASEIYDQNLDAVHNMIEWAITKLPKNKSATTKTSPSEYTNTNAGPINIYTNTNAGPISIYTNTNAGPINIYTDTTAKAIPIQRRAPKRGSDGKFSK